MIYIKVQDQHVLVIEPANLVDMKAGEVIHSPGNEVTVLYTPDLMWFQEELKKIVDSQRTIDLEAFDRLHKESISRKSVYNREYHSLKRIF